MAGYERADAMAADARVSAGGDGIRLRPAFEGSANIVGILAERILGQLPGLRDERRVHEGIAVMALDALGGRGINGQSPERRGGGPARRRSGLVRRRHAAAIQPLT